MSSGGVEDNISSTPLDPTMNRLVQQDLHKSETSRPISHESLRADIPIDGYSTPQRSSLNSRSSIAHSRGRTEGRPPLPHRSVSTPHPAIGRRKTSTAIQHHPTGSLRYMPDSSAQSQEWLLFSQTMENEGQLPTPSSGVHKRSTRRRELDSNADVTPSESVAEFQSPIVEQGGLHSSSSPSPSDFSGSEEYDSDSDTSISSVFSQPKNVPQSRGYFSLLTSPSLPSIPVLYRNILKCSIAYFIASLFTFSPYLSGLISNIASNGAGEGKPLPSGHMVATIAVYFNPAKTVGAMFEADIFCFFGLIYSSFICLASMSIFWWLETKHGWEWLAECVVIFWIGIAFSVLAWMKVWMGSPQFNTACSMIAITIFIVLVKEGGLEMLMEVAFIIFCGSVVSNAVCYIVWPQTATSNLQSNMTKTLDSFSTLLDMLTNTFLLEEGLHRHRYEKIQRAIENHQSSFTSLKKNLSEAKKEWYFSLRSKSSSAARVFGTKSPKTQRLAAYEDAIDSLNRLGQHLNGLRGGTRLQYELTRAGMVDRAKRKNREKVSSDIEDEEITMLEAAAAMFGDLVDDLGPPLKALSTTCIVSLKRLRESFVQSQEQKRRKEAAIQLHEFNELVEGIERALLRFESTSNHAVLRLYRRRAQESASSFGLPASGSHGGENVLLTSVDHENIFLVYFFIFTLQEFARELTFLVDAMERIFTVEQQRLTWIAWCKQVFSMLREKMSALSLRRDGHSNTAPTTKRRRPGLRRRISNALMPLDHPRPTFPKVKPHAPDTIQTPWKELTTYGKFKQTLWTFGKRLGERDTKFAIKTGMATAILAAPCFFDSTRPFFVKYWGDWALISYFIVMSPTVGATNFLSLHRVTGTLLGAGVAAGMYTLFPENAVVLSVFGFLFSLPCFYWLVGKPQYASSARFVLLTYNLTCLYCYNLRDEDLSAAHVAVDRAVAVIAGVAWAALVSRFWWPAEARRELSKVLSEFCLNMGWLYTRLVASNSFAPEYRNEGDEEDGGYSEGSALLTASRTRLNNSIQEFMAMELHLQIKLIELQALLSQTQHEPRLKGPFPVQLYRGILTSLQTILDKLHSMRCVTTREEWYTSVRKDFIIPVNKERHEMVGNIILYFSILSSSFRLKAPLPPYLPPAEKCRQHLVDAIRQLDIVRNRDVKGSRQLLFFAYALTMKGVTEELESLGKTLQNAFGVIGQTPEEFEALFMPPDESRRRIECV